MEVLLFATGLFGFASVVVVVLYLPQRIEGILEERRKAAEAQLNLARYKDRVGANGGRVDVRA